MESANETFSALLRPLGNGMEAFLSSRSLLTYGIVVLVFAIIFLRSLNVSWLFVTKQRNITLKSCNVLGL